MYSIKNRKLLEENLNDRLTKLQEAETPEERRAILEETKTLYDIRIHEKKEDNDKLTKLIQIGEDLVKGTIVAGGTLLTTVMVMDYERENIIPQKILGFANKIVDSLKK